MKLCIGKSLNFGPTILFSSMTRRSLSSSFWPKNQLLKRNIRLFPLIGLRITSGCFKKLSASKRRRFQDIEDIQKKKKVMTSLKAIPHQEFQKCFHQSHHRLVKYIAAQGEYFEGDPSQ
jgi:hypothetical protein